MASVRLLSESGHGLPRVGTVVDARLGERLVRVRVRVRVRMTVSEGKWRRWSSTDAVAIDR